MSAVEYVATKTTEARRPGDVYAYDTRGEPVTLREFLDSDPVMTSILDQHTIGFRTPREVNIVTARWRLADGRRALWTWVGHEVRSYRTPRQAKRGHRDTVQEVRARVPRGDERIR